MSSKATAYIIFYGITFFVFFGMHYYVFLGLNRCFRFGSPKTVMLLFTLLALAFPLCSILEKFYPNGFSMLLYAAASIWLGVLFLLLTAFLLYEPLRFFIKPNAHRGLVIVGIVALVSLYALIMGQLIFTKRVDIRLANLTGPVSIAHLSDVHVGTIHNSGYLARVVEKTNNLNPDLVVITGDFFDGLGPVNQHTVAPLANISAPAYFVIGNHERYSDMQRVVELMSGAGVTTLRNRVIETHGLQLVGADYPERENQRDNPYLKDMTIKPDSPAVLLYHQPSGIEDALRAGIDLQLSGHTHSGQMFPFNLLTRLFFPYLEGLYVIESLQLYVSPGSGTWGPPMRLGSRNQVTLITLLPQR